MTDKLAQKMLELEALINDIQQDRNKHEGGNEHILKQLQKDFGFKSIAEAQRQCKLITRQAKQAQQEFELSLKDFVRQNKEVINRYDYDID